MNINPVILGYANKSINFSGNKSTNSVEEEKMESPDNYVFLKMAAKLLADDYTQEDVKDAIQGIKTYTKNLKITKDPWTAFDITLQELKVPENKQKEIKEACRHAGLAGCTGAAVGVSCATGDPIPFLAYMATLAATYVGKKRD
jgi:hypothetical protein